MSHGERVCSAWVMDKCGPASEMRREDAWRVPAPGPGQIRVRVVCAALNPVCAHAESKLVCPCVAACRPRAMVLVCVGSCARP